MKFYIIYKLIDPTDDQIRYIGVTSNELKYRLKSHMSDNSKTHKCNWISKLKNIGLKPIIELIEDNIALREEASEKEIFYIDRFKKLGYKLTNCSLGGLTNIKVSDETKRKMSKSRIESKYKYICSEETKRKISESTRERMKDPNELEKLRISNKKYEDSKSIEQKINDIISQSCKPVIQYDKNMNYICEFISIKDARRKTNIDNISYCCNGRYKSAGGYIWKFKNKI